MRPAARDNPRRTRPANRGARKEASGAERGHAHKVTRANDCKGLGALLCNSCNVQTLRASRRREAASKDPSGGANWIILRHAKLPFAPQDEPVEFGAIIKLQRSVPI